MYKDKFEELLALGNKWSALIAADRHGAVSWSATERLNAGLELRRITAELQRLAPFAEAQNRYRGGSM